MARFGRLGSALLVIAAGAASIATSPRREHASWGVEAPAEQGLGIVLSVASSRAERGAKVQVSRAIVDSKFATGDVLLTGNVRWISPPLDPRTAVLAVELVAVGEPETTAVRKEIEIGRKVAQNFELRDLLRIDHCAKGVGCTMRYEIRFAWVEPRGGQLKIAWTVDGSAGVSGYQGEIAMPEGAAISVTPIDPHDTPAIAVPPPSDEPNPFPASTP